MRRGRRCGFSLIECLVACAILALTVLSISPAVVSAHAASRDSLRATRAVRLCEEMAERTLAVPYASIASFNGSLESPGQLRDIAGSLYPSDYQIFRRQVATQAQSQSVTGLGGAVAGMMVTVTVTDPKGQNWLVSRFIPQS